MKNTIGGLYDFILNIDRNTNNTHLLNTFKEEILDAVENNTQQIEGVNLKWQK